MRPIIIILSYLIHIYTIVICMIGDDGATFYHLPILMTERELGLVDQVVFGHLVVFFMLMKLTYAEWK